MPKPYEWKSLKNSGEIPVPRAGHTLSYVGGTKPNDPPGDILLIGGLIDQNDEDCNNPKSINDLYRIKLGGIECMWVKEKYEGNFPPRWGHSATVYDHNKKILVFGGYYSTTIRYNTSHILNVKTMENKNYSWEWAFKEEKDLFDTVPEDNYESPESVGAPEPRAHHSANLIEDKLYIFGGHGGEFQSRRCFNDISFLDLTSMKWTIIEDIQGLPPESRAGHSSAVLPSGNQIIFYGGWNTACQFSDMHMFNIETLEWQDLEIANKDPRWNHIGIMVEAIPSWKQFIFGGSTSEFSDGDKNRKMGKYCNDLCVFDADDRKWTEQDLEETSGLVKNSKPILRESAAMVQDHRESRLVIFGGWSNRWLNDLWSINVSKIVGPPYSISRITPLMGPITGKTPISIEGIGFEDNCTIKLYFQCGRQVEEAKEIRFVSPSELSAITPNFTNIGPKEAVVKVLMKDGDKSVTSTNFTFYLNTNANKTIALGPGLLCDQLIGTKTSFIIQARNELSENRKSGMDRYVVSIKKCKEDDEEEEFIECEIIDNNDGTTEIIFESAVECRAVIDVKFIDENDESIGIRGNPFSVGFKDGVNAKNNELTGPAIKAYIEKTFKDVEKLIADTKNTIATKMKTFDKDNKDLLSLKGNIEDVEGHTEGVQLKLDAVEETLKKLEMKSGTADKKNDFARKQKIFNSFQGLCKEVKETKKEIQTTIAEQAIKINNEVKLFEEELKKYHAELQKEPYQYYKTGVSQSLKHLDDTGNKLLDQKDKLKDLDDNSKGFDNFEACKVSQNTLNAINTDLSLIKSIWDHIKECTDNFDAILKIKFNEINADAKYEIVSALQKTLQAIKINRKSNVYQGINKEFKKWTTFLPLIQLLKDDAMRDRHWDKLFKELSTKQDKSVRCDIKNPDTTITALDSMLIYNQNDLVEEICDQSKQELKMEKTLANLEVLYSKVEYDLEEYKDGIFMLKVNDETYEQLEENQLNVQNMTASRFLAQFEKEVEFWNQSLGNIVDITLCLIEVQRKWSFLESLFIHSEEVKKELPEESAKFVEIDKSVRQMLKSGKDIKNIKSFCSTPNLLNNLESVTTDLARCEKALHEFLDGKRRAFPRFQFLATTELLDILSNGNNPPNIMVHMSKIMAGIQTLTLTEPSGGRPDATGMQASVGVEQVKWQTPCKLEGKVEVYCAMLLEKMITVLRAQLDASIKNQKGKKRTEWLFEDAAQITLCVIFVMWCFNVESKFLELSSNKDATKNYHTEQCNDLNDLIRLVQGDLTKPERSKIMCMITMDTHSRDITEKLVVEKVTTEDAFQWQAQLKLRWKTEEKDCEVYICDARFWYGYEYLGNGARLVITPLTDRIYVTATQALHLKMGCAPAGPAGTGKTESTKDLSSAMGKAIYVFNCSDQMDYKTMADIFKGLASSGSWGCFDEFNRLIPAVLSVCSVQFKAVCDGVKGAVKRFTLQGVEISLDPTCGAYITMNPGYLGRSELPEGLKALFRPITVMVPDLDLIMENMLMAEGFITAKSLASKFFCLQTLCRDLLSKQMHYDWGLRAIKSVLVVAGNMKRAEPTLTEDSILMRALRDFNVPKIVEDDMPVFSGLLGDLFPGVVVERKRDMKFEDVIVQVAVENKLGPEDEFILKIVQLGELMIVRHSVFIMGPPGCGKSSCFQILAKANKKDGRPTKIIDINPKAITSDEFYGFIVMATREWKDGIFAQSLRALSQEKDDNPKWIILDGDLDANWIESMNSVMDDNKMLTLANNERIPVKPNMKLIFEIRDLVYATPATVSRAGILYISDSSGFQQRAYIKSWLDQGKWKDNKETKAKFQKLFDSYIPPILNQLRKVIKRIVPVVDICNITSLCHMLDSLVDVDVAAPEQWFVFCCIWACGGSISEKDGRDWRKEFSQWWKSEFKIIRIPKGTVFDQQFDPEINQLEPWTNKVKEMEFDSTTDQMSNITVSTQETVACEQFMKALIRINKPTLVYGMSGCGKTQLIKGILKSLDPEKFTFTVINFNQYSDATALIAMLQNPLVKRAGKQQGPPGKAICIYYIDDLNMPKLDPYNTQSAIALLRQYTDYKHFYDMTKLAIKEIVSTQMLASMNPTAGSFIVNPRLQRHFWNLAIPFPDQSSLVTIQSTFMTGHFSKFKASVNEISSQVIKAALTLHDNVTKSFRKTAQNFHQEFNIRHISCVFQGLLTAKTAQFSEPDKLVKLWIHESARTQCDRLVNMANMKSYRLLVLELINKQFSKFNLKKYFNEKGAEPLVFAPFSHGMEELCQDIVDSYDKLNVILKDALVEYNENKASLDLVLFDDAMLHISRICRIVNNPCGHTLLIGVGGSGKQSLTKLSSYIMSMNEAGIVISSTYKINDLKEDLRKMQGRAGLKDEGVLFLLTEGQITDEKFLICINDLLASGEVTDLQPQEDKDNILNGVRSACKGAGIMDTPENLWNFFIQRIKNNLHMTLCFSPVGVGLRNKARKFPALINNTVIDWFHDWPFDALYSVASKFLKDSDLGNEDNREPITKFMPYSFGLVNEKSAEVYNIEKRFIYTTPKSFLELIYLYRDMLKVNKSVLEENKTRLEIGLVKLKETGEVVSKLGEELKVIQVEVEIKKDEADKIATVVGREKEIVGKEADSANIEADKCAIIAKEVSIKAVSCQKDLDAAIPLVEKAEAVLNSLKVDDFRTLKAFNNPPAGIDDVTSAVMCILAKIDPNVDVDKNGKPKELTFKAAKKMMNAPEKFIQLLKDLKGNWIDNGKLPDKNMIMCKPQLALENFTEEKMKSKSAAAAGLCVWVINICEQYNVVKYVEPKRLELEQAQETLAAANTKLEGIQKNVAELEAKLAVLVKEQDEAMDNKNKAIAESEKCESKMDIATRLINSLASENDRWEQGIIDLDTKLELLPGDVLLSASFVSYIGPFSKKFRQDIVNNYFIKFMKDNNIPRQSDGDALGLLCNDAIVAGWNNQKLPSDRVSTENGAILTNSARWSLIVDPQLQGITWLREKESSNNLQITRLANKNMSKVVEKSIEQGFSCLIENLQESVDAVLAPVIARTVSKRGGSKIMKLGDKELIYNANFKLLLHTKLSNPHFPPEIQAECTIINFAVTEDGLEDQLLSLVVKLERPDLASNKENLIKQQNEYKIKLKELEEGLLKSLSEAEGDILENIELVENLEESKRVSTDITEKSEIAKITFDKILEASEGQRPCASRGALIFFLMGELQKIHTFQMFSLDSYIIVVARSIRLVAADWIKRGLTKSKSKSSIKSGEEGEKKEGEEEKEEEKNVEEEEGGGEEGEEMDPKTFATRVEDLIDSLTINSFEFVRRGLFDKHKLIVSSILCFRILIKKQILTEQEVTHLVLGKIAMDNPKQPDSLKWMEYNQYIACKGLEQLPKFTNFGQSLDSDKTYWQKWYNETQPEQVDLPRQYKNFDQFTKLLFLRCMRPDRMQSALMDYVRNYLGNNYVEQQPFDIFTAFAESTPQTPLFFVLFPGVDPTNDIEKQGAHMSFTSANGKFINISMGQGQEDVAEDALTKGAKEGLWVMLQNIHLMEAWTIKLERQLEIVSDGAHNDFRCILSSEPPPLPYMKIIPESILQNALKVANESPADIKSNMKRAFNKFSQDNIDRCDKKKEFKAMLLALCTYHSLILGRKKFGSQGWSRGYNFNDGDLTVCGDVLLNYLNKYDIVPYSDIKQLQGEVMYGGHITDFWDRRTNNTYLNVLIKPELLSGMTLMAGFKSPDAGKYEYENYKNYIDEKLPAESPQMLYMHPNAEINYLIDTSTYVFETIQAVTGASAKSSGGDSGGDDLVGHFIEDTLGRVPELFQLLDLKAKVKDFNPFNTVALQEAERMNILNYNIKMSLLELQMGLSGALNITDDMEALTKNIELNQVPALWIKYSQFSKKNLAAWVNDLLERIQQFTDWTDKFEIPKSLWISGLFNSMSFLTAIMQSTARADSLALDKMSLNYVVTEFADPSEILGDNPCDEGAFIHGLFLEGVGWEKGGRGEGQLTDSLPKVMHPAFYVVQVIAVPTEKKKILGQYECPLYVTSMRGATFVTITRIKMESEDSDPNKWILTGACLLMSDD